MKNYCAMILWTLAMAGCQKEDALEILYAEIDSPCATLGENACHIGGIAVLICTENADGELIFQVNTLCEQVSQYCDLVIFEGDLDHTYVCNCEPMICEDGEGCPLGYPGPYCSLFVENESMCLCRECDDDFCNEECIEQGSLGGECTLDIDHLCECFSE